MKFSHWLSGFWLVWCYIIWINVWDSIHIYIQKKDNFRNDMLNCDLKQKGRNLMLVLAGWFWIQCQKNPNKIKFIFNQFWVVLCETFHLIVQCTCTFSCVSTNAWRYCGIRVRIGGQQEDDWIFYRNFWKLQRKKTKLFCEH